MDLIELCNKFESMEWVHQQLLADKDIREVIAPPQYEQIMKQLCQPRYGEISLASIVLHVSSYIPMGKIWLIYSDGSNKIVDFSD